MQKTNIFLEDLDFSRLKEHLPVLKSIGKYILLFIIILSAFLLSIDSKFYWGSSTHELSIEGDPYVLDPDGYYYLNEAKQLVDNTYSSIDKKRAYPDYYKRSALPPLLSVLLYEIASVTHLSLNYIGAYLPCFLGLFLALPLFFFGRNWGGDFMAYTAISLIYLFQYPAIRVAIGRLDTDCLNVTLALSCSYLFMQFAKCSNYRRYIYLIAGVLCYLVFLWWWDGARSAVTAFSLFPLLIALIFYYRPPKKEFFFLLILALTGIISILLFFENSLFTDLFSSLYNQFLYISKYTVDEFPKIGETIIEQRVLPFKTLIDTFLFSTPIFILSLIGFCWLVLTKKIEILFLLPLIIVGLFSLTFARRFGIFFAPVMAIGFGFFMSKVYYSLDKSKLFAILTFLLLGYIGWQSHNNRILGRPQHNKSTFLGMQNLNSITPKNSVIWSDWDTGHPLVYWSQRATIHDGMVHGGPRSVYGSWPLASDNFRFSANFMQFYVSHGIVGINTFADALDVKKTEAFLHLKKILEIGPVAGEKYLGKLPWKASRSQSPSVGWLKYLFPSVNESIYLFLNENMIANQRWIYWHGTWDISTRKGKEVLSSFRIDDIDFDNNNHIKSNKVVMDYDKGSIKINRIFEEPVFFEKIYTINKLQPSFVDFSDMPTNQHTRPFFTKVAYDTFKEEPYLHADSGTYILYIDIDRKQVRLMDKKRSEMIINRLFHRRNDFDRQYFQPIDIDSPYFQIWQIKGDQL